MNNKTRNIKEAQFGWYEKWAMKKIEDELPFRKQSGCKLVYIAICSMSAKQKNVAEFDCYKFDIARFASLSEKTVQRCLPLLEVLHIICTIPQDRLSNGKYTKVKIRLIKANSTAGHFGDTAETREHLQSPIYNKKLRNKEITKKKIQKERKTERQKKPTIDDAILNAIQANPAFGQFNSILKEHGMANKVNPEIFETLYRQFRDRLLWVPEIRKMTVYWKDRGNDKITSTILSNWLEKAIEFRKAGEIRKQQEDADRHHRAGIARPQNDLSATPGVQVEEGFSNLGDIAKRMGLQ